MLKSINLELPSELLNIISINRDHVNYKLKELIILELYREHKISSGKASEVLNISKEEFIYLSSINGICHIDYNVKDIERDYKNIINKVMKK